MSEQLHCCGNCRFNNFWKMQKRSKYRMWCTVEALGPQSSVYLAGTLGHVNIFSFFRCVINSMSCYPFSGPNLNVGVSVIAK